MEGLGMRGLMDSALKVLCDSPTSLRDSWTEGCDWTEAWAPALLEGCDWRPEERAMICSCLAADGDL